MKISEVIKELEKIKEELGDLTVLCWPYDGQIKPCNIQVDVDVDDKDSSITVLINHEDMYDQKHDILWLLTRGNI